MAGVNKVERRFLQFLIFGLAVICFVPGGASAFGGMNLSATLGGGEAIFGADSPLRGFADNQYRFGFGVFFAQGLALLFALRKLEKHVNVFRFVALALFIGGVARASNIMAFGVVDEQVVGPTVIELVVVPLLALWHARVTKNRAVS